MSVPPSHLKIELIRNALRFRVSSRRIFRYNTPPVMNDPRIQELRQLLPQAMLPDWVRLGSRAAQLADARPAARMPAIPGSARPPVVRKVRRPTFLRPVWKPESCPRSLIVRLLAGDFRATPGDCQSASAGGTAVAEMLG